MKARYPAGVSAAQYSAVPSRSTPKQFPPREPPALLMVPAKPFSAPARDSSASDGRDLADRGHVAADRARRGAVADAARRSERAHRERSDGRGVGGAHPHDDGSVAEADRAQRRERAARAPRDAREPQEDQRRDERRSGGGSIPRRAHGDAAAGHARRAAAGRGARRRRRARVAASTSRTSRSVARARAA